MKKLLIVLALLLAPAVVFSQGNRMDIPFNGLIVDAQGKGVAAKISVKNSDKRINAEKDGKFGLVNIKETDTLVVQYQKKTFEIPVAGRLSLKITVDADGNPSYRQDNDIAEQGFDYTKRRNARSAKDDMERLHRYPDLKTAILEEIPGAVSDGNNIYISDKSGNYLQMIHNVNNNLTGMLPATILVDGASVSDLNSIDIKTVKSIRLQESSNTYGSQGHSSSIVVTLIKQSKKKAD